MTTTRHDESFTDSHGVEIFYHRFEPGGSPRGVVQLAHGLGEHLFRYQYVIDRLVDRGYEVWANHHRGHGATGEAQWGGDPTKWGRLGPGGLDATVAGVAQLTDMIAQARPSTPRVFLGHSWGSLMGQILLNRGLATSLDGVIFSGSSLRLPGYMNSGDLNARHRHLGSTGAEWLSRDVAVHQAWVEDPWTFPAKTIELFGVIDAAKLLGVPKPVGKDLPMLLLVGSDDSLGGERGTRALARRYETRGGLTQVGVKIYPGARHEVFNETNRDEVIQDTLDWLDSVCPG